MKKVGIVTFFKNYNYGSVLQCYALQQVLYKFNIQPVALNQIEKGIRWKIIKAVRLAKLLLSVAAYPQRGIYVYKNYRESKRSCETLPDKIREGFDSFVRKNIYYENHSFDDLKKEGVFIGYISCSDQVWGTSGYFLNPYMFLQFTKKENRYAYAASFGSDKCPKWFAKKLRSYLYGYNKLSVREVSGLEILNQFGLESQIHVDPTLLLDVNEWKQIASNNHIKNYIFLYFLNEPSTLAINHINMLIKKNDIRYVLACPYKFRNYSEVNANIVFVNLSPEEFIGTIENARIVCTDSFHGSAFSIIFRRAFFTYYRQYAHNAVQNNRIETLLSHYMLQNQIVKEETNYNIPDYSMVTKIIENDRRSALTYLQLIIEDMK